MLRTASLAWLILIAAALPAMATDNGPGPKGSKQRTTFCDNQLNDCQKAAEDNCNKKGDKAGPYCLADGYGVCNVMHDNCMDKKIVVGPKQTPEGVGIKKPKAN